PAEPFETIRATIEADLGGTIEEIFESFDFEPLASASIGQAHRARLLTEDGPVEVVVKVQRPHARGIIDRDIDLLYWLAHTIERSVPEYRLYNPVKMVTEFDRSIHDELDFAQEADNCERFARNFSGDRHVKFPDVHRSASGKRVLTLEYLPGKKVYDAVRDGASGEEIAKRAVAAMVQQVFEDGFFHADPHPGNVLILGNPNDPVLGLIDVGMVGRLTPQMRDRTIDLMLAAIREDYRGIADALYAIGRPTKKIDRQAYEAEVAILSQKYLGKKLEDIELTALIRDLVNGAQKYGVEVPADFLMLGKSLMTVEGVGKEIYPELDLFEEVKPYFVKLMKQRYSPERITQDVMRGVMRMSAAATEMPIQMQEILEDLRKGAFRVQVKEADLKDAADQLGRRLFSGVVVGSLYISAALLAATNHYWPAAVTAVFATIYAGGHGALVFVLGRRSGRES
ncbi:MAG: AarF/ABC1/UbiB kinase family protein, partial [Polyangiaceae bacterium]|nr:AarF/ABC1/UbiB kinase family protein [Polyangiaceae bacterium]